MVRGMVRGESLYAEERELSPRSVRLRTPRLYFIFRGKVPFRISFFYPNRLEFISSGLSCRPVFRLFYSGAKRVRWSFAVATSILFALSLQRVRDFGSTVKCN